LKANAVCKLRCVVQAGTCITDDDIIACDIYKYKHRL